MHPFVELRERLSGTALTGSAGVRYHLRELLGEGGQGWVFRANYDDPEGFWVVVKVLRPEGLSADAMRRFEREAEVLRMLGASTTPTPNIVRYYDHGQHEVEVRGTVKAIPFTVLEYVEGATLGAVIQSHGGFGMPLTRTRRIMKQVARALHVVHSSRVVHRDLKPSNILLASQGNVELAKVTDFGLVKLPELGANRTATLAGASIGYAPPEQYEMGNERVSVQTDVFSFAAILFELLSGAEAFPYRAGDNPLRVVARMLSGERPTLERAIATVPRELRDRPDLVAALDAELTRALSSDPGVRHVSIRDLWERIEPLLREAAARMSSPSFDDSITGEGDLSFPSLEPITGDRSSVEAPTELAPVVMLPPRSISPTQLVTVGQPIRGERLRAVAFHPADDSLVALGTSALYRHARGVWGSLQLAPGIDPRFVRGLRRIPSGDLLIFGEGGFAVAITPSGVTAPLIAPDRDVTFLGSYADEHEILLVGERRSHAQGVLARLSPSGEGGAVEVVEGSRRFCGVTRIGAGRIVLCGHHGDLFEVLPSGIRAVPWGRTGHLFAIARARDGGAFAVGSGGHALRVGHPTTVPGVDIPPRATLEIVQTTRDLMSVAVDAAGGVWACGVAGRLLKRVHNTWTRLPLPIPAQANLIGVEPESERVMLVAEDGSVFEARE